MNEILHENSVWLQIFRNGVKMHSCERDILNDKFPEQILMQQHKFAYYVKLINFMRILSTAANSVNKILLNAYNNIIIN